MTNIYPLQDTVFDTTLALYNEMQFNLNKGAVPLYEIKLYISGDMFKVVQEPIPLLNAIHFVNAKAYSSGSWDETNRRYIINKDTWFAIVPALRSVK